MQGVTFEGGFELHLTSLIHSSTQKCKNLSISRKKGGRRVAAAVWPPTAEYGHGGRIRPLLATLAWPESPEPCTLVAVSVGRLPPAPYYRGQASRAVEAQLLLCTGAQGCAEMPSLIHSLVTCRPESSAGFQCARLSGALPVTYQRGSRMSTVPPVYWPKVELPLPYITRTMPGASRGTELN
jgi:hypothetical protein